MTTRREFIRLSAIGGAALAGGTYAFGNSFPSGKATDELSNLCSELLGTWTDALVRLVVTDQTREGDFGGIMCPACARVHGRVADSFYPMLYMADNKQQDKYLDAALLLYRWMEKHVSQPDGSWLNDPVEGAWKGITVFTAIALGESLKNHGDLLDTSTRKEIETRLKKAGDYIFKNFSIGYGNINYPVSASYGLSLLGTLLDIPEFREKGRAFAHEALGFFSRHDSLLTGEGGPYNQSSAKGCLSVDLGYNVEESLPALTLYGKLTNDQEVLEVVTRSLQAHMEFMLPDGAWDNSWGTRSFKWTYWGSRTSDGCQPAFALMSDRDARFYKVALRNTELLKTCTSDGLLYGGPHYLSHQVSPCVHHTFCHAKALTTILDHRITTPKNGAGKSVLPREKIYGSRFFPDIQTWLISTGNFRATVTGYDREYKMKNGHPTGGALTMLWHMVAGPLFAGSMNEYTLQESGNMQPDNDPLSMPLTPRIELVIDGVTYMNISDLKALIEVKEEENRLIVKTVSSLVDKDQVSPVTGVIKCHTIYTFYENRVILEFNFEKSAASNSIRVIFPVISGSDEKMVVLSDRVIQIHKKHSVVKILSNSDLMVLPTTNGRIFNFVPGFEAIPFAIYQPNSRIEFEVI